MRDNLAKLVVNATAERLTVEDFGIDFGRDEINAQESEQVSIESWAIWRQSLMPYAEFDLYCSALATGQGAVIVWFDEDGNVKLYVQDPLSVYIETDNETGKVIWASKIKRIDENTRRFIVYTADVINRYNITEGGAFTLFDSISNPYGIVPVFGFNSFNLIKDILPLQLALNKALADKLVAMEFAAYPQRYAVGLQYLDDLVSTGGAGDYTRFVAGVNHLWATDDKDVRFGEFSTANLSQFLEVAESYRLEIARLSGTPFHLLGLKQSDAIAGVALRTIESRFIRRIERLQSAFSESWANVMQFALMLAGKSVPEGRRLSIKWKDARVIDETERLDILARKAVVLGVPLDVLREEYGYSEGDIERFNEANADALAFEQAQSETQGQNQ
jgi:hypothetical protein